MYTLEQGRRAVKMASWPVAPWGWSGPWASLLKATAVHVTSPAHQPRYPTCTPSPKTPRLRAQGPGLASSRHCRMWGEL